MTTCSVIIVSEKTGSFLFAAIKSALNQPQLAELVVVDRGNPPDILARLQQIALTEPHLKIITGQENSNFNQACNLGVKQTTGDYIAFLREECLLSPSALMGSMQLLQQTPGATLAGSLVVDAKGTPLAESQGGPFTPGSFIKKTLNLQRFSRKKPLPLPVETQEVDTLSDAFISMRKNDFTRLHGLDERLNLWGGVIDLCVRVQKAGGKVMYMPHIQATRMPVVAAEKPSRAKAWLRGKDRMHYFYLHFEGIYFPGALLLTRGFILLHYLAQSIFLRRKCDSKPTIQDKQLRILASGYAELPESGDWDGVTILLTGATGGLGLYMLRRILSVGAHVIAVSGEDAIPFPHERLQWIKADISQYSDALNGVRAHAAIHCAPLWRLPSMLDNIAACGIRRLVTFGSVSVFAKTLSDNWFEKEYVALLSNSEAVVAEQCKIKNIDYTLFRPTQLYGTGFDDPTQEMDSIAARVKRFGRIFLYPPARGKRQPVHVDDVTIAVLQAMYNPKTLGKSYNLSGSEVITFKDMVVRLVAAMGITIRVVETTWLPFALDVAGRLLHKKNINREIAYRMNDDFSFFHDTATADFGFAPRAFLSGGISDIEGL